MNSVERPAVPRVWPDRDMEAASRITIHYFTGQGYVLSSRVSEVGVGEFHIELVDVPS